MADETRGHLFGRRDRGGNISLTGPDADFLANEVGDGPLAGEAKEAGAISHRIGLVLANAG